MRFITLLLGLALANGCAAAQPIVIKFSHVVASHTPKGKAAQRFKELAEQATGGRVTVALYPNSELYKDKEELEALQLGAVQMLAPSLAKFGQLGVREFELFDLPYIFPDSAALHRITEGPIGRDALKKLEVKGIVGLAYWDNGFKVMSANRPLLWPADFDGLKMRIQPSKVLDVQMRALGANPQALAFAEVYAALQRGVVDGTENPPSNFYTQRMYEVQRHLTVSNHGYLGYAVIVNKKFWDRLPSELREKLEQAMRSATVYANAIAEKENADALERIRQDGKTAVHHLSAAQKEAWQKALLPVHQELEGRIGKELIQAVKREINRPHLR
ncbi:TRAP transporter substrate-binding protein [Noviherbaspirillum sedimenti]|uniref:DctP family TRAP transporter solute-binding subunit n=1 Tax=Noviherbaspirillum sedimenti TaxID=2320865 RepID=A0A3A3G5D7_9BURK|nr:TRAP transporter substrate-binding protein [Noviherbaspirillum sedimenti]RJG03723.1 DctP family TRAP transporter solute-binding subunit [Noviherbaspirillum sedimenti]